MKGVPNWRDRSHQAFVLGALGNPSLTGSDNEETFNVRIETLDRSAGRYRIVALHGRSTTNPKSAVERYMYEVAVDVNLGAPGADASSYPSPSVENVHADFLIRGRGAVPGERNT